MGFEDTGACTIWSHRQQASLSRKNLQHGDNQITYYINEAQYQKIAKTQMPVTAHKTSDSNRGVMHLNIMYE
ncbi:pilus-assembly fibrillin subunit [Escherichia coli]|uniref:pilus-assembly fibrillin subunit n=1 Tax=Escherichia coli TaxID=562 RepID=UPI001CDB14C6|nr:pilus-assembly fibrillin subunit [Escherichia coli]MDA6123828.1 hypothetical protein [Escherichia coli]MEC9759264.1 pilus-assembly fibrillin subunit [Escherichia coli]